MNTVLAIIAQKFKIRGNLIKSCLFLGLSITLGFGLFLPSYSQIPETASVYTNDQGVQFNRQAFRVDSLQSEELMLEGVKEKILGNLTLAKDYFDRSIYADPKNDASLYELALIEIASKDYLKAKSFIEKALEVKPSEPYYLIALAEIYSGLRDWTQLLSTYSLLIQKQPLKSEYYQAKGEILEMQGKVEEAIGIYDQYKKLSGDVDFAELQKQKIYLSHDRFEEAAKSMKLLIEESPQNMRYYLLISEVYRSMGKAGLALDSLQSALRRNPEDGFLHLGIFEYYASQQKEQLADGALEKVFHSDDIGVLQKVNILEDYYLTKGLGSAKTIAKLGQQLAIDYPEDASIKNLNNKILLKNISDGNKDRKSLAGILEKEGGAYTSWKSLILLDFKENDMKAVISHTSKALEFYPNQAELYWYQGNAHKILKEYSIAVKSIQQGLELSKGAENPESLLLAELGEILQASGKFKESDSAFTESLKRNVNPMVLNNFAFYLALRNYKIETADSMAKKANELQPRNASFEDTYAWILYKERFFDRALLWIEKAIKDDKTGASIFQDHYGDILFENRQIEKAIEAWKKAVSLGSRNVLLPIKIKNKRP